MKTFLPKFLILFILIFIVIGFYTYAIEPKLSGGLGKLGKIPFGIEYSNLSSGRKNALTDFHYEDCRHPDSIANYPIVNIGDSFSLCDEYGYLNYFGAMCPARVGNIFRDKFNDPIDDYIALLNNDYFQDGQIVILESVERLFLWRLFSVNLQNDRMPDFSEETENAGTSKRPDRLLETLQWIRLSCNFRNPVLHYKLSDDYFEHDRYSRDLYVYDEDLKFMGEDVKQIALNKLDSLNILSVAKGVHFYFLICTDKYDAYEPFIAEPHAVNKTLDNLPDKAYIINPRQHIRTAIEQGTKDIYKVNDTHTTDIGGEIFAQCLWNRIINGHPLVNSDANALVRDFKW